jgi:hypothetical protein
MHTNTAGTARWICTAGQCPTSKRSQQSTASSYGLKHAAVVCARQVQHPCPRAAPPGTFRLLYLGRSEYRLEQPVVRHCCGVLVAAAASCVMLLMLGMAVQRLLS